MLLIPVLALALLSFFASTFVILRIVIPILPPHPLSRRVPPSEFGLPNFRSLSPADKSHIWLAALDLLALAAFVWQAISEYSGGATGNAIATDPVSVARVWFALTLRQSCLLVVAALTLLHVRLGRSVTFGAKHWVLWAPMLILVATSTAIASVMAGADMPTFFVGLTAYSVTVAIISSVCFMCLIGTLMIIKSNLAALNEASDPWPPAKAEIDQPRPSFATEEVDMLRDGASWITSNASSRRNSASAWSFSTHQTHIHASQSSLPTGVGYKSSVPGKSSFWFNASNSAPPVPPLPSPYANAPLSPTAQSLHEPDPFRRQSLPPPAAGYGREQRPRFGSQTSWLTSSQGSHTAPSAWSFPATHPDSSAIDVREPDLRAELLAPRVSRPNTPAMSSAQVLGGYGYSPDHQAEKGMNKLANLVAAPTDSELDISIWRAVGWLLMIWIPTGLSLPYLMTASSVSGPTPVIMEILLMISIASSSPILAANLLLRSPLPIPTGLFDVRSNSQTTLTGGSSGSTLPTHFSHEYKKSNGTTIAGRSTGEYKRSTSASITVVEGRRSGDVWMANGDAKDGRSKIMRVLTMLEPRPKLSVLPSEEDEDSITPPLPLQDPSMSLVHHNMHSPSQGSAEMGRLRTDSAISSGPGDDSLGFGSKIMIAQRHYSALAQTVVIPGSPHDVATATAVATVKQVSHLRSRSHSSTPSVSSPLAANFNNSASPSPPPACPLPPTPPNVRAARLAQLKHKKSFSSGFSIRAIGNEMDLNEIDEMTAGVLPFLVPGLKVGRDMKITTGDYSPPSTLSRSSGRKEFGFNADKMEFSSPQVHSTPYTVTNAQRKRKISEKHRRQHLSLPSLGLGKDGVHSLARWTADIKAALNTQTVQMPYQDIQSARRNTVWGGEVVVAASDDQVSLQRKMSTRLAGVRPDVPSGIESGRSSCALEPPVLPKSSTRSSFVPPSAASTVTLFDLEPPKDWDLSKLDEEGPLAESTPHNNVQQKTSRQGTKIKPKPKLQETKAAKSSIVYIKSPTNENAQRISEEPTFAPSHSFARLIPKAGDQINKLRAKLPSPTLKNVKEGSPSSGLRPLSLLQDRDTNSSSDNSNDSITMPLKIGKKKSRSKLNENAENNFPTPSTSSKKGLRPLQLVRSESSNVRGALRKGKALPDVVVRPPSNSQHIGYAYSFNE